ncbi:hypothetical protein [uncultured Halopseudomonas sp.]|uniref:hypothetical protein n=1 Tax=uncultured Halopseudomonas sp. TaxID=2901193 RepID=UPI0030ED9405|tara:strand:+ start:13625 stop:13906 length:282 start_codon:yes stop_codon:yes gene_type:complete
MKYIMLQIMTGTQGDLVREFPVIFPDALVHADVAEAITKLPELATAKPVAAGFLSSLGLEAECYGESETLQIKSRGDLDSSRICMLDYSHGIV